jgi:hypothetical protein
MQFEPIWFGNALAELECFMGLQASGEHTRLRYSTAYAVVIQVGLVEVWYK